MVALFAPDRTPAEQGSPVYRALSDEEANDVLTHLAERPLNIGAKDFRISGAGAQDKLVACVEKGRILLPLNGTSPRTSSSLALGVPRKRVQRVLLHETSQGVRPPFRIGMIQNMWYILNLTYLMVIIHP